MIFKGKLILGTFYLKNIACDDLEFIRESRNNKENTTFLRPLPYITSEKQREWYEDQLTSIDSYAFSAFDGDVIVGSCSIYEIKETQAEFGRILLSSLYKGKGYGYKTTILSIYFSFFILNMKKVVATVNVNNEIAINLYKKVGFRFLDKKTLPWGGEEYIIEIDKEAFINQNPMIESIRQE